MIPQLFPYHTDRIGVILNINRNNYEYGNAREHKRVLLLLLLPAFCISKFDKIFHITVYGSMYCYYNNCEFNYYSIDAVFE